MSRIRVLVGLMPRMLREIVTGLLSAEPDMELVGECEQQAALLGMLRRRRPDVVVLGYAQVHDGELGRHLFDDSPYLKVLAVAADGRRGSLFELVPQETPLGEISPDRLLQAIRDSVRQPAEQVSGVDS